MLTGKSIELGTAPVEADGSFFVETPADRPIRFALLDAHGAVLRQEQGWFWARRGEQRICVGCHTGPERAAENRVPVFTALVPEVDPGQHFLVTNSREPATKAADSGEVFSPLTASATVTSDLDSTTESDHPDLVVRILRRDSGEVMLLTAYGPPFICPSTRWATWRICAAAEQSGC